jgi:hypothetical protein
LPVREATVSCPDSRPFDIGDEVWVLAEGCYAYVVDVRHYPLNQNEWEFACAQSQKQFKHKELSKHAWFSTQEITA